MSNAREQTQLFLTWSRTPASRAGYAAARLQQLTKGGQGEPGVPHDPAHRECVHGVVTGYGDDADAIRHDDVLALTGNVKPRLL